MTDEFQPPPDVVRATQKFGPTHALGLDRLVGVHSNIRQGEPFDNMRLDLDFNCGIAPIRVNEKNFELGLRTCFVSLKLKNCEVAVWSQYEHWLGVGAIESSELKRTTTARSREVAAGVNVDLDSTRGLAALAAKLGLGALAKRSANTESVTKQSARIELVVTSGQDRWRVGDLTRGDARRPDGILSGSYFVEERTTEGDHLPLCRLRRLNRASPAQVSIVVTASFGSLLIFQSNPDISPPGATAVEARQTILRRSHRASIEHEDLLRAHVAGLVAAKKLREAQAKDGMDVLNNEFVIALETLLALPEEASLPPTETE